MPAASTKPKGLVAKLAEVMGLVDKPIAKGGFNKAQQYAFVNESDVSAAIRPLLAERGIWLCSTELSQEMTELFRTSSGNTMFLTRVTMQFQFIDGESGEVTPTQTYSGQGADTGDKSLPKAQSMALKYFLLKTFMLSTGKDDAEADEKVDKAAAASGATRGARRVTPSDQQGVERGGKSDVATKAQIDEIARLTVSAGLDAKGLIPIIEKVVNATPPEGAKPREWLGTISSKQAADIISRLSSLSVDKPVEEVGTDNDPDTVEIEQETLDIV